jgi:hypothetical protein
MNVSDWINVFLAVCRLILYLVEIWNDRRKNGGHSGTS